MNTYRTILLAGVATFSPAALIAADTGAATPSAANPDHNHVILDHDPARARVPYSDAVIAGDTLYVAGHIGADPKTGQAPSDTELEIRLLMDSIRRTVEGSGFNMDNIVSVQVYCTDIGLYGTFNKIYASYFQRQYPARALVGVATLVRGAHFEVSAIAVKGIR